MKFRFIALIALFLLAGQAYAELIIIGDVDAPNTESRSQNYDLLENVRNGATDIAWLTGGYPVNNRYDDLRSRWTTAGATITDDLTAGVAIPLSDRGLVVVSQLWSEVSLFDAGAMNEIASYIAAGGEVLYIAQVSGDAELVSYNAFLTGIGSTMQFLDNSGNSTGDEIIDTGTPYGQGVSAFELGGWTAISGGIPVVTLNGEVGVAYGSGSGGAYEPVPTMSTWALGILFVLLGLTVFAGRRRLSQ